MLCLTAELTVAHVLQLLEIAQRGLQQLGWDDLPDLVNNSDVSPPTAVFAPPPSPQEEDFDDPSPGAAELPTASPPLFEQPVPEAADPTPDSTPNENV